MVDVISAIEATRAAVDLVRAAIGVKSSAETSAAVTAVYAQLLTSQVLASELLEKTTRLEKALDEAIKRHAAQEEEIARIHEFEADVKQYKAQQVAPGAFAYVAAQAGDPAGGEHEAAQWLCAHCFENKQKSILQYAGHEAGDQLFKCGRCGNAIRLRAQSAGVTVADAVRKRRQRWEGLVE